MKKFLWTLCFATIAFGAHAAERAVVFSEYFDSFTEGTANSPAEEEISANGVVDASLTGSFQWKGRGLHSAGGALAVLHFEKSDWMGPYEVVGYIECPYTDVRLDGGSFTVRFKAKSLPADGAKVHIEVYDPYTSNAIDAAVVDVTDSWAVYEVPLVHPGYGNHLAYVQMASEANDWLIDDFEIVQNYEGLMPPVAHFAKNVSYEQFTANWNPVPFATGYLLSAFSVDEKGNRIYVVENQPVDQCEHTVTGTVRGTDYYYTVQSTNASYTSVETEPIKVHVPLDFLDVPVVLNATDISETGFTARWEPVFRAMGYIVNLKRSHVALSDEDCTVLHEDFSKCENEYGYSQPFYGKTDDVTNMPGWIFPEYWSRYDSGMLGFSNMYHAYEDIYVESPVLDLSNAGGKFSVKVQVVGEKGRTVTLSSNGMAKTYKLESDRDDFEMVYDNGSDNTVLRFSYDGKGDLYFDDIEISQTIKTGETVTEQIGVFNTADETIPKSGDVARTEYVFTGLDLRPGDSFVYTVKAWSWSLGEDGVWGPTVYSDVSLPMTVNMGNSGISVVESEEIVVRSVASDIIVNTLEPLDVEIYNVEGRLCGSYRIGSGSTVIESPVHGFAIVKAGSCVFRVMVR